MYNLYGSCAIYQYQMCQFHKGQSGFAFGPHTPYRVSNESENSLSNGLPKEGTEANYTTQYNQYLHTYTYTYTYCIEFYYIVLIFVNSIVIMTLGSQILIRWESILLLYNFYKLCQKIKKLEKRTKVYGFIEILTKYLSDLGCSVFFACNMCGNSLRQTFFFWHIVI